MSDYLPRIRVDDIEFEGDTIAFDMESLERSDYIPLTRNMEVQDDGSVKMSFTSQMEFTETTAKLLLKYVHDFSGLKDKNGNAVPLETVVSRMYFQDLAGEMVKRLFSASRMDVDSEKKSGKLHEQGSKALLAETTTSPESASST